MTGEARHSLREHTGMLDQSTKGDDYDQSWNEHQQRQGKCDLIWEDLVTGTLDQSTKGDNGDQGWNEYHQLQGKRDIVWGNLLGHLIRVRRTTMMTKAEMNTSNDNESMILVLMNLDGTPDLNKNNESSRSELVLIVRIIKSAQCDKCDKDSPCLAAMG